MSETRHELCGCKLPKETTAETPIVDRCFMPWGTCAKCGDGDKELSFHSCGAGYCSYCYRNVTWCVKCGERMN